MENSISEWVSFLMDNDIYVREHDDKYSILIPFYISSYGLRTPLEASISIIDRLEESIRSAHLGHEEIIDIRSKIVLIQKAAILFLGTAPVGVIT